MRTLLERTARNLNAMGFHARVFDTPEQAKAAAISLIGRASVGFGGSDSVESLGIYEALQAQGNALYWKRKAPEALHDQLRRQAMGADWYLLSANALTVSGKLVNIDGHGNRIAASIYGPKRVLFLVGRNKLVEGGIIDAIDRAHRCACAVLARRRGRDTPCAFTGVCVDCNAPQRSCRATLILEKPMTMGQEIYVFLVDADLGL